MSGYSTRIEGFEIIHKAYQVEVSHRNTKNRLDNRPVFRIPQSKKSHFFDPVFYIVKIKTFY